MINPFTEFEVTTVYHYEDTKGNAKCRNWGGLGWLGSTKAIGNITVHTTSYSTLIETMLIPCTVLKS